ncbi:MAG TPA: hypothetical protein VJR89_06915 [Polyangiales bacterium]|nr:hypothetical protein [Polyangiales bacterium]
MLRARSLQHALCISVLVGAFGCADAADTPEADGGAEYTAPRVRYPEAGSTREFRLSQTGLYRDIAHKELAPDLIEYEPAYKLWSDGADKRRWLRLPKGTAVDTSDMDHWSFPIGTMFFKEFSLEGRLLETRLIARLGPEPEDYFMGAFVWNEAESDAVFVPDGAPDVRGTDHDVPETKRCSTCHRGERGRILGYSAVQQAAPEAKLSDPPNEPYVVPGDDLAREALGYLHANCGNCHNESGTARTDTRLTLRLEVTQHSVEDTSVYRSTVGVKVDHWLNKGFELEIAPGDPEHSAVLARMQSRNKDDAMPPFASERIDPDGVALVRRWIEALGERTQ